MADPSPTGRPASPQKRGELTVVITVLATAIVFGAAISFLPFLGKTAPEVDEAARLYRDAFVTAKTDPDKAMAMFGEIKSSGGEWYERAQAQMERLKDELAARPPEPTAKEKADYETLLEAWRKHAGDPDELIRQGEAFVMAHPRGELRPDVEERIAHARRARSELRVKEADAVEASVARALARKEFSEALQAIEQAAGRLRPELDVWPRLAARRDAIVADARKHYLKQVDESNRLVKAGEKDDARRLWYATIRVFGDGKVPELADLHRAALLRAEEIRP